MTPGRSFRKSDNGQSTIGRIRYVDETFSSTLSGLSLQLCSVSLRSDFMYLSKRSLVRMQERLEESLKARTPTTLATPPANRLEIKRNDPCLYGDEEMPMKDAKYVLE